MVAQGNTMCRIYLDESVGGRTAVMAAVGVMVGGAVQGDAAQGLHLFLCMAGLCVPVCVSLYVLCDGNHVGLW